MAHMYLSPAQLEHRVGDGYVEKTGEICEIDKIGMPAAFTAISALGRDATTDRLYPFHLDHQLSL